MDTPNPPSATWHTHHMRIFQVDLLPEIGMVPSMYPPADQLLPQPVQADVDTFLETRQPGTALTSLKSRLLLREGDPAMQVSRYSVPLVNALVCYLGAQVGGGVLFLEVFFPSVFM